MTMPSSKAILRKLQFELKSIAALGKFYVKKNAQEARDRASRKKVAKKSTRTKKVHRKAPTKAEVEANTIAMLQQDCRDLGVKFHHMNKAPKLRELLKAAGELATV